MHTPRGRGQVLPGERGSAVVEFAIATPRPYGHATVMGMADDLRAGLIAFGPPTSES